MTILERLHSADGAEYKCTECGKPLDMREDQFGRIYQCRAYDCLAFFDADEIEPPAMFTALEGNDQRSEK